jgi:hypothetical protein
LIFPLEILFFHPAASIARKIYLRQGIGVGGFQKIYGGRQRNGSCPPHFCKSSGAISRNILQQLQKMGIIDVDPKGYFICIVFFWLDGLFLDLVLSLLCFVFVAVEGSSHPKEDVI